VNDSVTRKFSVFSEKRNDKSYREHKPCTDETTAFSHTWIFSRHITTYQSIQSTNVLKNGVWFPINFCHQLILTLTYLMILFAYYTQSLAKVKYPVCPLAVLHGLTKMEELLCEQSVFSPGAVNILLFCGRGPTHASSEVTLFRATLRIS